MADSDIHLELSRDEALVFFEWLSRFNKVANSTFDDQAEQRVLWDIEGKLESILTEPLDSNYDERLAEARAHVRDLVE